MHELEIPFDPALTVPGFLIGDLQAKLAYIDETIAEAIVASDGASARLRLLLPPDPERADALRSKVARVLEAMVRGAVQPRQNVLEDHLDRVVPSAEDPMPGLLADRQVVPEARGLVAIGPEIVRLTSLFDQAFVRLAESFDAAPHLFPALLPATLLEKVEYFRSFPHSLTFATHLREDLDAIEGFAANARCEGEELQVGQGALAGIRALLSPAVCFHYYGALSGTRLDQGVCATAVGSCFRYESSNLRSLERLWNFTMREIIFVGPRDFVLDNRETARRRAAALLEDWGLAYRVETAHDPFFVGDFKKQAAFQSAFQLKYEIRARIPHRQGTLAVGSYNFHQDFFGRHLDITLADGAPAFTGCVAFGLERLAYAFLSQYGRESSSWPAAVRQPTGSAA